MAMQLFFLHNDEMSTWRLFKFIEVKMDGAGMEGNYFSMKWMVVRPLPIFLYTYNKNNNKIMMIIRP